MLDRKNFAKAESESPDSVYHTGMLYCLEIMAATESASL